jgi:hypothetical protein
VDLFTVSALTIPIRIQYVVVHHCIILKIRLFAVISHKVVFFALDRLCLCCLVFVREQPLACFLDNFDNSRNPSPGR